MKLLNLIFSGLLLVGAAFAQAPSKPAPVDAPTVTVTQINWHQEVFVPALYEDPMRINQDRDDLERDQKAQTLANADRAKQGQAPLPSPTKKVASNTPVGSTPMGTPLGDEPAGNRNLPARGDPGVASVHYVYEARVKNTGVKTIRTIVWAYSLFNSDHPNVEVGHHAFTSVVSIRPGKSLNLVGRSKAPATRVVEASKSTKESLDKLSGSVVIDRLVYDDGSFWQRTSN
ncbi:MAG TPA: hypothetical protein VK582_06215 [Pyrinomonadaceae bacterium]|nr:hypothetical protein [Pyrinomonadaceae bacterium]